MIVTRDLVGGLGATMIGAAYLACAARIRQSALDDTVGPAGLPRAYGLLMIGVALAIAACALIRTIRQRRTGVAPAAEWSGSGVRILRAAGMLAIGIGYLLAVAQLGYVIAIALLIAATALYQGAAPGWRLPAVACGGAVALWLIFVMLLGVDMPRGALVLL